MRARAFKQSMAAFEAIFKDPQADKDLAAEAMYWFGDINLQMESSKPKDAYRAWKKLTWDYPESKWAKFARGRLTEDVMINAEQQLEQQR
jgi:TolA-binding protein